MKRPRTETWFARQLDHVRACNAEADRRHTPEELAAAAAALAVDPTHPQAPLPLQAGEIEHA